MINDQCLPLINAFHPDFMKTYYPDFTKEFRTTEANQAERKINEPRKVIKPPRASVKIPKTSINSKSQQRMTMEQVKEEILKRTNFYTYSKAGAPK
jgi:tRNA A-37 threonylcarbamoyl transferase component Bud32